MEKKSAKIVEGVCGKKSLRTTDLVYVIARNYKMTSTTELLQHEIGFFRAKCYCLQIRNYDLKWIDWVINEYYLYRFQHQCLLIDFNKALYFYEETLTGVFIHSHYTLVKEWLVNFLHYLSNLTSTPRLCSRFDNPDISSSIHLKLGPAFT